MIFFCEDSLRKAIREFVEHYYAERNHKGLDNRLIIPLKTSATTIGAVQSRRGWEVCSTTTVAKPHDENSDSRRPRDLSTTVVSRLLGSLPACSEFAHPTQQKVT
jgi:hypothetical protein